MSLVAKNGYTMTASMLHWMAAVPMIASIGSVLKAQQSPKEEKGLWMHRHKSMGLLAGMVVAPRFAYRLLSRSSYNVRELQGNSAIENMAGKAGHYGLYAFMTIMPASGIAMGYFGGKGLPFFSTSFAGAVPANDDEKKRNGNIAKNSFNVHKTLGTYGKYLVPAHAGAAFFHYFRGQAIFTRINPFRPTRG